MSEDSNTVAEKPTILARKTVARLDRWFGVAGGIMLLVLMIVVTADVVGRYVFSSPLRGSFEYIQICMALLIFLALPAVVAREENVQVEVFEVLIPRPLRRLTRIAGLALSIVAVCGFAWVSYLRASSFHASGERFVLLSAPLYLVAYFIFAMWVICVAIMLVQFVLYPRFLRNREDGK